MSCIMEPLFHRAFYLKQALNSNIIIPFWGEQYSDREPGREWPAALLSGDPADLHGDHLQAVAVAADGGTLHGLQDGPGLHHTRLHSHHHWNCNRQVRTTQGLIYFCIFPVWRKKVPFGKKCSLEPTLSGHDATIEEVSRLTGLFTFGLLVKGGDLFRGGEST